MDPQVFATLERIAAETDESQEAAHEGRVGAGPRGPLRQRRQPFRPVELVRPGQPGLVGRDGDDIVPQIIEVKTVGLGDTDYIEDDLRGMRAYWQGKGGQILSDVLRYERTFMPREEIVTAIDGHQDEFALNFWGSFDRLRAQANEKVRQAPVQRLVELVRAAVTRAPSTARSPRPR
jgi:hypothetical protein